MDGHPLSLRTGDEVGEEARGKRGIRTPLAGRFGPCASGMRARSGETDTDMQVENLSIPYGGSQGYTSIVSWAQQNSVDLCIPGPEQPLVDGVELLFRKG